MMSGLLADLKVLANKLGVPDPAHEGALIHGIWVKEIYDDGMLQIVTSRYKQGDHYPEHAHPEAYELLWCVTGAFVVAQPSKDDVLLTATESLCLPPMQVHSVTCLQDGELLAICRPPERVYQFQRL